MTRSRRRKIVLIAILVLALLLIAGAYLNYRATRRLGFGIVFDAAGALQPPEYLFSFSGPDGDRLSNPVGVLVDGERVLVTDSRRSQISVFTREGRFIRHFGTGDTVVPLYIAKHPVSGEYWVTDRRRQAIEVFSTAGEYLRDFDPKLPKEQLPDFDAKGRQWAPIALAFGPDGTLYVTEMLKGHRLLIFGPDGKFKRSVGTAGGVQRIEENEDYFLFPNSIKVHGDEVWVSDSNNRRLKVYSPDGEFLRLVAADGLPRGIDFLPKLRGEKEDAPNKLVSMDTLAHDATIWTVRGEKVLSFGENGVLEGQFNYPNDIAVDPATAYMYIADTSNRRIQVWGWPAEAEVIPTPKTPWQWALCGVPFLPLLLLPFMRRRRFHATPDFVVRMVETEVAGLMPSRRRRWVVEAGQHETVGAIECDDPRMAELFEPYEHSDADARALMEKMDIAHETAVVLAVAQRAHVFCTEDRELRRLAKLLEIDVVDRDEFLERFEPKRYDSAEDTGPTDTSAED